MSADEESTTGDSGAGDSGAGGPERSESYPVDVPAELELHVGSGLVGVTLTDDAKAVTVSVRLGTGAWWQRGLSDLVAALGTPGAEAGHRPGGDEALAETHITFSAPRHRLVVRSPRSGGSRGVALVVHVGAPTGSRVLVRTGSAGTDIGGTGGELDVSTGSGDVTTGDVLGPTEIRTGSGDVRTAHLHRGGTLRSGSGSLTVEATSGDLDLVTGSGALRIGIAGGIPAELDIRSGSGRAHSELRPMTEAPTAGGAGPGKGAQPIAVRARTGSGDALVHARR